METINGLVDSLTDGAKQSARYRTARGTRMTAHYVYDTANHGRITADDIAAVTMLDEVESNRIAVDMHKANVNTAVVDEFAPKRNGFAHPILITVLILGAIGALFLTVLFGPPMLFVYALLALIVGPLYLRNRWEQINQYDIHPGVTLHDQSEETVDALETRVYEEAVENDPAYENAPVEEDTDTQEIPVVDPDAETQPIDTYQDDPYAHRV